MESILHWLGGIHRFLGKNWNVSFGFLFFRGEFIIYLPSISYMPNLTYQPVFLLTFFFQFLFYLCLQTICLLHYWWILCHPLLLREQIRFQIPVFFNREKTLSGSCFWNITMVMIPDELGSTWWKNYGQDIPLVSGMLFTKRYFSPISKFYCCLQILKPSNSESLLISNKLFVVE